MGRRNYLVEGVSGTGKTSVADELQRRGYEVVHGDRELAYQGDPATGAPLPGTSHQHHLWRVDDVRALAADRHEAATFFCGGSRNHAQLVDVFDRVFVLQVDLPTLRRRLAGRSGDEFGGRPSELAIVERAHRTGEDTPDGVLVDATVPIGQVVDRILEAVGADLDRPMGGTGP